MTTRKKPQFLSRSNNHPTQITEFKFLPPEIWTQILEKSPAKTLLKFRCVCKSWCSIIDQTEFIHTHPQISQILNSGNDNRSLLSLELVEYHGNRCPGCLLTLRHPKTLQETSSIFRKSDLYSYRIIGSCNGLILVNRIGGFYVYQKDLRLWNPCIRKSLVIPACPFHRSLLLDCVYLFGYAPVNKDYKVIAIASEKGEGEETRKMYVAIYTLSDQQWTIRNDELNIKLPNVIDMFLPFYCLSSAVFLKGVAYWLGNVDKQRNELTHLGSFDFDKEEIVLLELPSSWGSFKFLFLFGESLAIFRITEVASSIWVLDQDNKKEPWTRRFLGKSSQDGYKLFRCFVNEKVFFCESDGGYFICGNKSYNIASCEVREYEGFNYFKLQLEMYLESLVLSNVYGARDLRFFP
ncbi:F-box/kelch-repeat protein At3g23880-like [Silene latifolia]|uniref:F-box/kelch-repeat protein At3g23880-like n=1 Tax=Silene latifolia TaxID=37657 RepID=UPI003D787B26